MSAALLALALSGFHAPLTARRAEASLPAELEAFLRDEARGVAADRETLLSGGPVIKCSTPIATEVAVFGAIWVNAPSALYVEQVKQIEQFERGGTVRLTRRFSDPPRLDDLAALDISDEDFEDLRECRLGDCGLKLDAGAVQRLRKAIDGQQPSSKAEASAILRQLAFEYVGRYRAGGNAALAVYRDQERPTYVANEFRSMIDQLPWLATQLPELKGYLLDYPHAVLPNSTDFLYWQEVQFGLKPTVRINQLIIQERPGSKVVASKLLYSSHYFRSALEVRRLLDDPARGRGFWFTTVNHSRCDGLSGLRGRLISARVRSEVHNATRAALMAVKAKLEARRGE